MNLSKLFALVLLSFPNLIGYSVRSDNNLNYFEREATEIRLDEQGIANRAGKAFQPRPSFPTKKREDAPSNHVMMGAIFEILKDALASNFPTAVAKNISDDCIHDSIIYAQNVYTSLWARKSK